MKKLCVLIPTQDRAELIESYLENRIDDLESYNIDLIIYDSSENDATEIIVTRQSNVHKNIKYRRFINDGRKNKGAVALEECSKLYEYVWLVGDRIMLNVVTLYTQIEKAMSGQYDLIHVYKNKYGIETGEFTDICSFFYSFGWSMTHYGAFIISSKLALWIADRLADKDYILKTKVFLIQMAIFHYLSEFPAKIFYIHESLFTPTPNPLNVKGSEISEKRVLQTWTKGWVNSINGLPSVYDPAKSFVMKSLSDNIGFFSYYGVTRSRLDGNLTWRKVYQYREYIKQVTDTKLIWFYLVSATPASFLSLALKAYYFVKRGLKRCIY